MSQSSDTNYRPEQDRLYIYTKGRREVDSKHKFYLFGGVVLSLILILMALNIATSRSSYFGRASGQGGASLGNTALSMENSYVFASPISATADGISIIRVTVFLLNNQGVGLAGQTVTLKVSGPVNVATLSPTSDNFGRATFDLTSNTPGDYTLSAEVAGATLPQTVSVSFR